MAATSPRTAASAAALPAAPASANPSSGRAMSSQTIQARIPAGVADGQRIRLPGKGAPRERGGKSGDLYVRVNVKPDEVFSRSGDNLTVTVPVTITELALGADIKVPTHRGPAVTLRVKPGSANGTGRRVAGRGVRKKDGTSGDLRVTLEVTEVRAKFKYDGKDPPKIDGTEKGRR